MCTIISVRWIANAAARFSGTHGAVSAQARRADCSRQAIYDQARKVQDAVEAEHSGGPSRQQLLEQNQALRQDNADMRLSEIGYEIGLLPARHLETFYKKKQAVECELVRLEKTRSGTPQTRPMKCVS